MQNKRAIKRTENNPGGLISMEVVVCSSLLIRPFSSIQIMLTCQGDAPATDFILMIAVPFALLQCDAC